MRKIIASTLFVALAGTLAVATPRQDRDDQGDRHDNGKHKGEYKYVDDDGDRHDHGKHKGWYKHGDRDDYQGWDDDHDLPARSSLSIRTLRARERSIHCAQD